MPSKYPKQNLYMSHCVFCSTLGQLDEAVSVYNSTPLQELSDLTGLALACCRAGLIGESVNGKKWGLHINQVVHVLSCQSDSEHTVMFQL